MPRWRQLSGWLLAVCIPVLAVVFPFPSAPGHIALAQPVQPSAELAGLEEISNNFYKAGAFAESFEYAEKALALTIREFGPEHERTGIRTYSLGYVAEALARWPVAERFYRDSARIRDKVYGIDSAGTSQALEKLGSVVLKQGRLDEAEALFNRVLNIRRGLLGGDHAYSASAYADLGDVSMARGNAPAALTSYRNAVRLLTSQRTTQVLAQAVYDQEIRRQRSAFSGLANAAWETASRPGGNRAALMTESYAASQQAWSTSAASALARMSARIGAGSSELGQRIRRSQDGAERILALGEEDQKTLAGWSEVQRTSPAYIALLDEFRQGSTAQGRDNAPNLARQKVLVAELQALMKRCPPGKKPAGCERSDTDLQAITKELGALSQEASKGSAALMAVHGRMEAAEKLLPGYAEFQSRRKARWDEMQRIERAITEERAAIVRLFPDYVALTEPQPLTIAETQALLQPNEALVTIIVGPTRSFVWALSHERAEWAAIDAGAATLAEHVAVLRRGLDPNAPDQSDATGNVVPAFDVERAHTLYRLLFGTVAPVLAGKQHLIIVPTGPLSSLPFQVLVSEPPTVYPEAGQTIRNAQWLIRRHAMSVLPSVQSLAALRKLPPAGTAPKPFLGIGDPTLTGPPEAVPKQRGAAARLVPASAYRNGAADLRALREMVPLPETADELRAIAKVLGAAGDDVMLRASATETRVKRTQLDAYRVIHFATHGLIAGELSGLDEPALVLTPPDKPSELDDGLLTASEIAALRLSADWVVLSACNTAAGADVGAEALSGLARAFFFAGARALLVSHWAVNSQAAVWLTTRTFETLAKDRKIGRAEAFRRTMLGFIDSGLPPTYWAPFIVVGEGAGGR